MRFFHGDSPSQEFKSRQQKGGYYYCSGCGAHADRVYDLAYTFHCTTVSLDDRQKIVLKGPIGKRNSLLQKPKPFTALQNPELESKLGGGEYMMERQGKKCKSYWKRISRVLAECQHFSSVALKAHWNL